MCVCRLCRKQAGRLVCGGNFWACSVVDFRLGADGDSRCRPPKCPGELHELRDPVAGTAKN